MGCRHHGRLELTSSSSGRGVVSTPAAARRAGVPFRTSNTRAWIGARMRLQDTQANCGPASLHNALAAIGIHRTQDELEALCKTTGTAGTSPRNLQAAIRALGRVPVVINERRDEVAVLMLDAWLREGRPVVLCVDGGSHWVAAVGTLGRTQVLVADPADNELVLSYGWGNLVARWGAEGRYYGIVV